MRWYVQLARDFYVPVVFGIVGFWLDNVIDEPALWAAYGYFAGTINWVMHSD